MSSYASELANARLNALRTLVDALKEAETPEEKRRCAVAIFNAPDPCDLDDEIELVDDEDDDDQDDKNDDSENQVSATQAESNVQENSAVEDAPLRTNPNSTSHTDPALLHRGEFDHLLCRHINSAHPP